MWHELKDLKIDSSHTKEYRTHGEMMKDIYDYLIQNLWKLQRVDEEFFPNIDMERSYHIYLMELKVSSWPDVICFQKWTGYLDTGHRVKDFVRWNRCSTFEDLGYLLKGDDPSLRIQIKTPLLLEIWRKVDGGHTDAMSFGEMPRE